MIQLSGINIYPIKSLGGIQLQKAKIGKKGLFLDRRWMLVDPRGKFITQRKHSKMTLIGLKWLEDQDRLQIYDRQKRIAPISLNITPPTSKETITVQIWEDQCEALLVGSSYDQWFSELLAFPCRLVYMPDATKRRVSLKYAAPTDEVSFADGFPYLICNEASLAAVNDRLDTPITMDRFRPNLIFTGQQAWQEDQWKGFSIGSVAFRSLKPCARCTLLTVDPQTGEKGVEPIRTLSTFRKINHKILFGMNACWDHDHNGDQPMEIKVGDTIKVEL